MVTKGLHFLVIGTATEKTFLLIEMVNTFSWTRTFWRKVSSSSSLGLNREVYTTLEYHPIFTTKGMTAMAKNHAKL